MIKRGNYGREIVCPKMQIYHLRASNLTGVAMYFMKVRQGFVCSIRLYS